MAEVGLAFLSASLTVLFDRMTSCEVVDFMQGRKRTEDLLRKLKTTLLSVTVVLEDAEEKQLTNPFVKSWVDELRDALYDAEDILDEIATEAKLDAESLTTAEKVSDWFEKFFNKLDQNINEVLARLEDLEKQKDVMGLQVGVGGKQYPERLSTSYVSESDTFGRDEDEKNVIDLLLSSDARGNEMCVIAIVGMGGIGKTTLAQLVYNNRLVKQHFDLRIWFCVSVDHSVLSKVKKSIIEAATSSTCNIEDHSELLQVTLEKHLNGKKFLLVLDDVWSEEPHHYQELLVQLLHYGNRGSKILVTTRSEKVALAMRSIETHHLKLLPKEDCWLLFEKHAFRNGSSSNADPKIKKIGTQIVEKCKGLPLAIKAIGDLLWSEPNVEWSESNVERWTNILKSNLWDLPMEGTYILPALRLSYKYLPSNLKRCFAYCSIFPKDYIFKKDELVLLWMAESFLQQSEVLTMEEVGNRCFDALVSRSLFQQSSRETKSGFVMHDLVNDLAKSVAGQFCTDNLKKIVKMTRYVSYFDTSSDNFKNIKEDDLEEEDLLKPAKHLRTFLSLDLSGRRREFQMHFSCLRVLSLSKINGMSKLLNSMSKMKYLRYLDVSFTDINELPDSICSLCNLQTLKLSHCQDLDRLPINMCKLNNLRHLEIDGTDKLKEMPRHMGSLSLQTLTKFIVSQQSGSLIGELGKLINLRGKLSIWELQNVGSAKDALDAGLKDKGYLKELELRWNPSNKFGILKSQRDVLENLQPHENLEGLTINYYGWYDFPDWIALRLPSLYKISRIELSNCKYCSALPQLGQLPSLIELRIEGFDEVVNVGLEFYGNGTCSKMKPFEKLKLLRLQNMSKWENWDHLSVQNEVEAFSQLEELYIQNCPKLRGALPVHLPSLARLEISECQHLEGSLVSLPRGGLLSTLKRLTMKDCEKLELPMHRQHSSLEELFLTNCCDSLTFFQLDLFPNLKSLDIKGCTNLQSLEQYGGDDHLEISGIGIHRCPSFVDFPGGLRAPNLAKLTLDNCESLSSMPEEMQLPSLHYLEIRDCPEVESFPEGKLPSNLKQIVISGCKKLIANWTGWGLQILHSLEWLEIGGKSENVESFPGKLSLPTTLTNLSIYSFENLKSLDRFQHLTSLVQLKIRYCSKLESLPKEGFPASLRFLDIDHCPVLVKQLERKDKGKEWPMVLARVPNIIVQERILGDDEWPTWVSPYQ